MIESLQPETAMTVRNRLEKPEGSLNGERSRSDLLINDKERNRTSLDSNSLEGPRKKKIDTEMNQRLWNQSCMFFNQLLDSKQKRI
ncbi:unnamed protein product [Brassica rapa subsp. trilocularis]